jgi:hypothetical protein
MSLKTVCANFTLDKTHSGRPGAMTTPWEVGWRVCPFRPLSIAYHSCGESCVRCLASVGIGCTPLTAHIPET